MSIERNLTGNHAKQIAGEYAAHLVNDGDIVGLGTGSTTAYAIKELGQMIKTDFKILGVPTSHQSRFLAIECGIPLTSLDEHPLLDISIDGSDQVDKKLNVIKGGGGAHMLEKIIAQSSKRYVIVVDDEKLTDHLNYSVAVEVLPIALSFVRERLKIIGGKPVLRSAVRKDGPVITDHGNFIVDVDFGVIDFPEKLEVELSCCTGVMEHGIFSFVNEVYVGTKNGKIEVLRR
ncbi:MAG: ribose-5-phosphate isomerase RpiA [Methanosarcinales archaeon]|nr:MAG: ribose-5-phosphate isomerase RpiA [Methanosarcinales archaeon]